MVHSRFSTAGAALAVGIALISGCGGGGSSALIGGDTLRVPEDFPTIQAAINVALPGDTVRVAPGTYRETLVVSTRDLTLASRFSETADPLDIEHTIIDGAGGTVIAVRSTAPATAIIGFTIQNGDDGISCAAKTTITDNVITNNGDGIDFEAGGGTIARNDIHGNRDDGIDLDGASKPSILDNRIHDNGDDGIEIRLHDYAGTALHIAIRGNRITGNGEDGIQLIDYPGLSARRITIARNVISTNALVGIGFMANGNTIEDFSGAAIEERINITNNTLAANLYGITGGGNAIILNNIITDSAAVGARNATGNAVIAYTLFWNNGLDYENSTVDLPTLLQVDPQLGPDYTPLAASPVIDAGTIQYVWNGELVFAVTPTDYLGPQPDLGAIELR